MSAFDDLAKAIAAASSEWGLSSIPFATIQAAVADLDARLKALEAEVKAAKP